MDSGNFAVMYSQNTKTVKAICAMTPPPGVATNPPIVNRSGSSCRTGTVTLAARRPDLLSSQLQFVLALKDSGPLTWRRRPDGGISVIVDGWQAHQNGQLQLADQRDRFVLAYQRGHRVIILAAELGLVH